MSTTAPATSPGPSLRADAPGADVLPHALHGPVLLAADGRAKTDAAAATARLAAGRLAARLEVLAVVEPLLAYTVGYDIPVLPPDFEARRRADLHAAVCRQLEPVLGSREHWHLDVRGGPPARVITDVARERKAGLIVLGTGGHRVVDRLVGDEVSLEVVRHASTPVLAVAPDRSGPMRRAVVGIDFSAASIRAAQAALALLDPGPDGAALLTLVHARSPLEDVPMLAAWSSEYDANVGTLFSRLRELLRPYVPDGVIVETRLRSGAVVECLTEAAAHTGADLVAVGTHGPGWVERLFVGSVAAATLRKARTTVLVAPAPAAADRVRLELRVAGQVALDRPEDWAGALDALTQRNRGRRARLEVTAPELRGFEVEAERYRFRGATYDSRDGRLTVMLGDAAAPAGHLTHVATHVRSVEIVADEPQEGAQRDRALLVEDARGQAVLTFVD